MQKTMIAILKEATRHIWPDAVLKNHPSQDKKPLVLREATNIRPSLCGLHSILKYNQYDEQTMLFYNDNSVACCFEITTTASTRENMTRRLNAFWSHMRTIPNPPDIGIQWCLFSNPQQDTRRKLHGSHHNQPIRLLISLTKTGSHQDRQLVTVMSTQRILLNTALHAANLPAIPLNAHGLINFLWPILNPTYLFAPQALPNRRYNANKSIKDQITRFGQHVRIKADETLFGLPLLQEGDEDKRIAMRGFNVQRYPPSKQTLREMAKIIGACFEHGLQSPCPFLMSGGVFSGDVFPHRNTSDKLYRPYHHLLLFAPKNTINQVSQNAHHLWRNERLTPCLRQLSALYISLPMTLTSAESDYAPPISRTHRTSLHRISCNRPINHTVKRHTIPPQNLLLSHSKTQWLHRHSQDFEC